MEQLYFACFHLSLWFTNQLRLLASYDARSIWFSANVITSLFERRASLLLLSMNYTMGSKPTHMYILNCATHMRRYSQMVRPARRRKQLQNDHLISTLIVSKHKSHSWPILQHDNTGLLNSRTPPGIRIVYLNQTFSSHSIEWGIFCKLRAWNAPSDEVTSFDSISFSIAWYLHFICANLFRMRKARRGNSRST